MLLLFLALAPFSFPHIEPLAPSRLKHFAFAEFHLYIVSSNKKGVVELIYDSCKGELRGGYEKDSQQWKCFISGLNKHDLHFFVDLYDDGDEVEIVH